MNWFKRLPRTSTVTTRSPIVATQLFNYAWAMQGQAVIAMKPAGHDTEPASKILQSCVDWASAGLPPGAAVFMAPIVDGDGAVLTARSLDDMNQTIARLARLLGDGGVELRPM